MRFLRNGIFEPDWAIVIVDSISDIVRLALRARVKPADDSLQLGEFPNHLGGKITLGKFRRAIRFCHMGLHQAAVEPLLGKPAGNGADAFHFVAVTPQPRFVHDAFEFRQIVGQPTFLIRLPEKLRVRQTGAQHSLVAGTHQPLGIFGKIDDREKMRRDFPALLLDGEILLVPAHHGNQNFIGQRRNAGSKSPSSTLGHSLR